MRAVRAAVEPPSLPRALGWALGSGTILQGFNSSIIAVALVSIGVAFGDTDSLPWLVSGLYIACAVASPAAGRLVDIFGARRLYLAGLIVVLVASLVGPFAPSVGWLIADRIVLGIGASMHFPAAMSVIRRQAEIRAASGRSAIGTIALCGQSMAAIGPSIGGVIVLIFGWQGIFWVNLPLVTGSAILVLALVPRDAERARNVPMIRVLARLDPLGLLLFVAALVCLMTGLLELGGVAGGDFLALALIPGSIPLWALFALWELRTAVPFIDLRMLARHRQLAATCGRAIVTFLAFYCVFYGMPQWLETGRGLGPAVAGLLMFPVFGAGVVSTLAATAAGRHMSPRGMLIVGSSGFAVAGSLIAILLTAETPYWVMILVGVSLGIPNGFNNIGNQLLLHASVSVDVAGVASGLYRTAQYVGAAISAVVVTFVLVPSRANGGIVGLGVTIASIGGFLAILTAAAIIRDKRRSDPTIA